MRQKPVDLLTLTPETDVEVLVSQIVRQEALISEQRKPQLRKLIYKLIEKIDITDVAQNFYLFKVRMQPFSPTRTRAGRMRYAASGVSSHILSLCPIRSCVPTFCRSPIVPSTSRVTASSRAAMIGRARCVKLYPGV